MRTLLATLSLATLASPALAQDAGTRWYFQTSLAIQHWSPSPEHVSYNALINLERHTASNYLVGGAHFKNSFGQPTQFLYVGKTWRPLEQHQYMYVKLSAGLVHGYKDEYRDKIPFNGSGIAPAIVPAIGINNKRFGSELVIFGTAGVLWTAGVYW